MPDAPDEGAPGSRPDDADWLLEQLSGGRRARREAEARAAAEAAQRAQQEADGEQAAPASDEAPSAETRAEPTPAEGTGLFPRDPDFAAPVVLTPPTPAPAPTPAVEPEPEVPAGPSFIEPARTEPAFTAPVFTAPAVSPESASEPTPEPPPTPEHESDPDADAHAANSAVWSLFSDFDDDEDDATPAPGELTPAAEPADGAAEAAPSFFWGLRAGDDPEHLAPTAPTPAPTPAEAPADRADDAPDEVPQSPLVPPIIAAPVFGAPPTQPPMYPSSAAVPPASADDRAADRAAEQTGEQPEPEPESSPVDEAPPSLAPIPATSAAGLDDDLAHWFAPAPAVDPEPDADASTDSNRDGSDDGEPDLGIEEEARQSSFLDTTAALPAVSALAMPPAAFGFPIPADDAAGAGGIPVPGEPGAAAAAATGPVSGSADGGSGTPGGPGGPSGPDGGSSGRPRLNRVLVWVAVALIALIVLVGLFFLGTRLPSIFGAAATPSPSEKATTSATPTPTPTPTPEVTGPQAAGEHPWDQLGGGECIDPYAGPWVETFTVVDCAAPHAAQLVYRGSFGGDATTPFPGEEALAAQINALCTAPGIIDMTAAAPYADLQLQGSYPITDEQWTTTNRHYYCFVSRSGGEPMTASIAGPGPAA